MSAPETHQIDPQGEAFLVNRFGDKYLDSVNGKAFSRLGASSVFRDVFGESLFEQDTLYVIVGSDSGLLIRYVLNKGLPDGSRYLFVELPEVLECILGEYGETLVEDDRIAFCSLRDWNQHSERFQAQNYFFIDKVELLRSIGASELHLEDYEVLADQIHQELDLLRWVLRNQLTDKHFIEIQLQNLAEAVIPGRVLKDAFPGQTAVILAGGPSLDGVLPWVAENREKLLVIAVSRISGSLQAAGIVPDIVCTVDPKPVSFNVSREFLSFPPHVVLVFANHTYPPLVSQWHGKSVYMGARFPWNSDQDEGNLSMPGPTVTNVAIHLALEMGVGRVVFGGLDLCLNRAGFSHASHSVESRTGANFSFIGQQLETNAGEMADTNQAYYTAARHVEALAEVARRKGCRFINPAPDAAKLAGVDHLPLDAITLTPNERRIPEIIGRLVPDVDAKGRVSHIGAMDIELIRAENTVKKIRSLAREGLQCNDGLFGRNGKEANFKYKHKMDKVERQLDTKFGNFSTLVKRYGIKSFLRIIKPNRDSEWSDEEVEEAGRVYYEAYKEGAELLLETIRKTRERLHLRRAEEDEMPNIGRLCKAWEEAREPGRARLWRERHAAESVRLTRADTTLLEQTEKAFDEFVSRDLVARRRQVGLPRRVKKAPVTAALAFRRRDIDRLERILSGLEGLEIDGAEEAERLVRGYRHELLGELDDALACYAAVSQDNLKHPALRRRFVLLTQMQRYREACDVLVVLSKLAPSYMPKHAEMLNLLGDAGAAMQVYTDYLQIAPEDFSAFIGLGRILLAQGAINEARWAFSVVVERDPDNVTARHYLSQVEVNA